MTLRQLNLFIVGQAESGTLILDDSLVQHLDVFMPREKGTPFLGRDLQEESERSLGGKK